MVDRVAQRILVELDADGEVGHDAGEPLRWLLHGGPGTGKNHVMQIIKDRLFKNVLGWEMGVNF